MFLIPSLIVYSVVVFVILYVVMNYLVSGNKCVCIIVLGDIGRSPRMQYHSLSFAKECFHVDIVGYGGSKPHSMLRNNSLIQQHMLPAVPVLSGVPKLLVYVIKVLWQSVTLGLCLLLLPKYRYLLVQNPPAIPTLVIAWVVSLLRGSKLIIDWHNYGYTILRLALGPSHMLVKFSKWYERIVGRLATANLCVSEAMREDLKMNWNVKAVTLYDRPPEMFQTASVDVQHQLFLKLSKSFEEFRSLDGVCDVEDTIFTIKVEQSGASLRDKRPALIVSSTSWTEDEDFGLLLSALQDYEGAVQMGDNKLPDVLCVITGKGPQKEYYSHLLSQQHWNHVRFCLPWLEAEDYPQLLASADVGVCLHMSSSGVDLPMKVVDMFGCGLPVCAVNYHSLQELVKHENNGMVFSDSKQLSEQLQELLSGFPGSQSKLNYFRKNLMPFQSKKWHDSWKSVVLPLLRDIE